MPLTIAAYYKRFKSVSGVVAGTVAATPLLSAVLPSSKAAYFFPPLGDLTTAARFGVVLLAGVMTYIAFFHDKPLRPSVMWELWGLALVCCFAYLAFCMYFVRTIDDPAQATTIRVSVGYERTAFAQKNFSTDNDESMLRARGPQEEEIFRLWTMRSICVTRLLLFGSVCGVLLPIVLIFSLGVRSQCD